MNIFNRVDCTGGGRNNNTGFGTCYLDPKLIIGGFDVPSTFKLTKEQLSTPAKTLAALTAAAKHDDPSQRIYPIHNFVNQADNSDDIVTRTTSDGSESVVRDGLTKWSFEFTVGGLALHRAERTHNQNGGYYIFYDSDFVIFGWGVNREILGIPLNYKWFKPWKMNDGSNPAIYALSMAFQPRYINEEGGFAKINSGLQTVRGLRDIQIVLNEFNSDEGTGNFSLLTEDSAYNLYDLYSTEFADEALYNLINSQTGEVVDILTVTKKASDKSFDFAIDTSDEDYPVDEGDIMVMTLVDVSVLEAAGIEGFEGLSMDLEIAANS